MSKRIFSARTSLLTEPAPECYYHKHPITHFCTLNEACTLPLCDECLAIHRREHIKNKEIAEEGIIGYRKAKENALEALKNRQKQIVGVQQKFRGKFKELRRQMLEVIDRVFDQTCEDTLIEDGNLRLLAEIGQRTGQIEKGSLRELIRYYQDIYGAEHSRKLYKMYSGDALNNFKPEFDKDAFERLCKDSIGQLKQDTNDKPVIRDTQPVEIDPFVPQKDTNIHLQNKPSRKPEVIIPTPQASVIPEPRQPPPPIRLSTAPAEKETSGVQGTIYTDNSSKIMMNNGSRVSSNHSSKVKRKKGLSLSKSHKELAINALPISTINTFSKIPSLQPSQDQTNPRESRDTGRSVTSPQRKTNWRDFVEMGPSAPLNPKQMRQMLGRNRSAEWGKVHDGMLR